MSSRKLTNQSGSSFKKLSQPEHPHTRFEIQSLLELKSVAANGIGGWGLKWGSSGNRIQPDPKSHLLNITRAGQL